MATATTSNLISSISQYRRLVVQMADNHEPYRTDADREFDALTAKTVRESTNEDLKRMIFLDYVDSYIAMDEIGAEEEMQEIINWFKMAGVYEEAKRELSSHGVVELP